MKKHCVLIRKRSSGVPINLTDASKKSPENGRFQKRTTLRFRRVSERPRRIRAAQRPMRLGLFDRETRHAARPWHWPALGYALAIRGMWFGNAALQTKTGKAQQTDVALFERSVSGHPPGTQRDVLFVSAW